MLHSFHRHVYGKVFRKSSICTGLTAVRDPKEFSAGIQCIQPLYRSGKKSLGIINDNIAIPVFQADQLLPADQAVVIYNINYLFRVCIDIQQRKKRSVNPVFLKRNLFALQHKPYRVTKEIGKINFSIMFCFNYVEQCASCVINCCQIRILFMRNQLFQAEVSANFFYIRHKYHPATICFPLYRLRPDQCISVQHFLNLRNRVEHHDVNDG